MTKIESIVGIKQLPVQTCSAVYFLCQTGKIIYVGKTINLSARIGWHSAEKKFDSVFYLPTQRKKLGSLERHFIRLFKPRMNGHTKKPIPKGLMQITFRLPKYIVKFLDTEKVRTRKSKANLIFEALIKAYPIQTKKGQQP